MIDKFLQYLQYERGFSSHTVLSYRTDLYQFCRFLDVLPEQFSPEDITQEDIRRWILSKLDEGVGARTISRKISGLKSFWRYLISQGITKTNITNNIVLPKTKKPLPAFYKESEMDRLFESQSKEQENDFVAVRDRVIINLLYQTGLRVSELIALRDEDVDCEEKQLRVLGKGNKERIVPMGPGLCEAINGYKEIRADSIKEATEALFILESGSKMYSKAVYNIVRKKMSEVSSLHKHSPHVLRHTFATSLLNNGAELNAVKDLLGHSSLRATQVYTNVSFSELKKIYKQAHPRAVKKGG